MLLFLIPLANAATLDVPAAYPTITDALAAAVAGDEIVLAPGVYCEDVDIDVPVILRGTASAAAPLIDGTCANGSNAVMVTSAGSGTVLQDLEIDGAGLFRTLLIQSSTDVTARDVVIRGGSSGDGAGLRVDSSGSFTCTGCRIESNTSTARGGGIYAIGEVVLEDSVLCDNTAVDGAGGYLAGASTFRRTSIVRNTAERGGGLWVTGRAGHQVHNSVLYENVQTGDTAYGSAIFVGDSLDLRNTLVVGNTGSIYAIDNDDEVNPGGYNLFADNLTNGVAEPHPGDILGGAVTFVNPGAGCTFDLSMAAASPNDGFGTGDPAMDPSGGLVDMGLGWVPPAGADADGDGDGFWDTVDCDPGDASIYPGASEGCNEIDNDCFEGVGSAEIDDDGDGFRNCEGDCNDGDLSIFPGAPLTDADVGDGVDRDCNGFDECFLDGDLDGYGISGSYVDSDEYDVCLAGGALADGDCSDSDGTRFPGADEICDGVDNDCDGSIDDEDDVVVGAPTWYHDGDGDGFGDPNDSTVACSAPADHVADNTDCNDGDRDVSPAGSEICDGTDNDCDGAVDDADDDVTGQTTWYPDLDADGYGAEGGAGALACDRPINTSANTNDCDDTEVNINPDAPEQCDGIDNDCDTEVDEDVTFEDWWPDGDSDGFGDSNATPVNDCAAPADTVNNGDDCNDSDRYVSPSVPETPCDGIDNDCDPYTEDQDGTCYPDSGDTGVPSDTDTDTDTDSDTDTDTDTDSDVDTDTDTDTSDGPNTKEAPKPDAPEYGVGCGCTSGETRSGWSSLWMRRR